MCGICGVYRNQGRPVVVEELRTMADTMMHRGPDEDGFMVNGSIGLGFRRLSIVDLAHGHQPMTNEDRSVWVICNGEIYNHKFLRAQMESRGHVFASSSDTEVIVHLYEEYGIDLVQHLRGMFAISIVDLKSRDLYLIRDPFGIKPLYFSHTSDGLTFASDLRSLLAVHPYFSLNEQAMWDYFTFQYVPAGESLIRGIEKVPPAHILRYRDGTLSRYQYWRPEYKPRYDMSFDDFTEALREGLQKSVHSHLQGDVRVGSFLSSGVDSSTLAAIAAREQDLMTFSVGFEDAAPHLDELKFAKQTAQLLGLRNEFEVISSKDIWTDLPVMLDALEEPLGDPSALALYYLSELAKRHVTVVLSGEGADELFGGYPIYHEPKSLALFKHLPNWSTTLARRVGESMPYGMKGKSFLLRGTTPLERRFLGNIHVFHEDVKHTLFESGAFLREPNPTYRITDPIYRQNHHVDEITRMQIIDLNTWLPGDILLKADKMTMAHSLELRVPFLDTDLFELASTVPTEYRVFEKQGKYVLRQAAAQWLPKEVRERPKLGFPVPYRKWLRESMGQLLWDVFQSSSIRHYFSARYVEDMLLQHRSGARDYGRELWTLLSFLMWYQVFEGRVQVGQNAVEWQQVGPAS
ncbi:asparagine synthase (glutamine-hydrolyzing) [Alicyclobacillus ferrooxydans]|uniref:asparagine synthase (glutamine-hydrolyzing) n=1 Tax=Alicyclobacillus ferrooxydans TaxID=471514 RepID=A0A0N8PNN0_9BACL|nr:asparagine synthase (glutamine-hydrolyzing) [Alicyclobacillus ferrooxydans]KPV41981.1 hypothetical protein AN477_19590 [Alicyclobacillus ferrooxydans]